MIFKKLIAIIALSLSLFAFTACESKGPVEKAGKKIDQSMEKASDKAKEASEAVKNKAEGVGQAVKKTTQ
jgi:predicted small lipoprotein YifL